MKNKPISRSFLKLTVFLLACGTMTASATEDGDHPEKKVPVATQVILERNPAIALWVNLSLGVINEDEMMKEVTAQKIDFKKSLQKETDAMKTDMKGDVHLNSKQFTELLKKHAQVSSFHSGRVIGVEDDQAVFEHKVHLKTDRSYIATVKTDLKKLPEEIQKKFTR